MKSKINDIKQSIINSFEPVKLHPNRKDLTGLKIGKLTVLKPVKTGKNGHSEWLCECECGNLKIAQTYRLLSGRITSCNDCYHSVNQYTFIIKDLMQENKQYKQALEEIREIAKDDYTANSHRFFKIEELINEVLK